MGGRYYRHSGRRRSSTLARRLPRGRTLITVSHSLQRAQYGEQPVWMGAVLAAMLGQIGLPGGGYNYALGALGHYRPPAQRACRFRRCRKARTASPTSSRSRASPTCCSIRASRSTTTAGRCNYPDIRLVYWAGGNPFHHHQDLNRLRRAFNGPTPSSCTRAPGPPMAQSRRHRAAGDHDAGARRHRRRRHRSEADRDAQGRRPDRRSARRFRYFCRAVASDWASNEAFTEGRDSRQWLAHLYEPTRRRLPTPAGMRRASTSSGSAANSRCRQPPTTAAFCAPSATIPSTTSCRRRAARSRSIRRPSQASATTIARPTRPGCRSTEPPDARHPLTLIANQPATRLHSQLDFGAYSQSKKIAGREAVRLNPVDAARRGIADGDIVRLFNDRGACLAAAAVTDDVMPGVVQLSTGAWYDPRAGAAEHPLCVHGNPNVLTRDVGTSRLAQGCCGQVTVVECEKYPGALPAIRAFDPPDQD